MTKRDLFVVIYTCVWASCVIICFTLNWYFGWIERSTFVVCANLLFLTITSLFVFIPSIRRWVDKHIIEKLP